MRSVSLTTTSARANATSGSPIEWVKAMATFVPHSGWTRGLPGATASATSTTGGSASHATAIRWTASSAHARPSADRPAGSANRGGEGEGELRPPWGMEGGPARRDALRHVHHRRQRLPRDRDPVDRVLRARAALGHDHRDRLADVPRAIAAEGPLGRLADVERDRRGEAGRWRAKERQRLHPAREIVEREDGGDAGERLRGNGIDPREPGVGVRRAQERRVEHPRERHVVDVARLAPQEPRVLPPPHRRAEILRSHRASSRRLYTGFPVAAACAMLPATMSEGGSR